MSCLESLHRAAIAAPRHIVLPEGEDPRIIAAALEATRKAMAQLTLIGDPSKVNNLIGEAGGTAEDIAILNPADYPDHQRYADLYAEHRAHKGATPESAAAKMREPLAIAAMMVRAGDAEGAIGGAVATTADTVREALQIIGKAPGAALVSSLFLMILDQPHHRRKGAYLFGDCGLVVDPDANELSHIAAQTAASFTALVGEEPRVAMLSFSTFGSAKHERTAKVAEATKLLKAMRPELPVDGEVQFDVAIDPGVNAAKAPGSVTKGEANVLIFPNLDAGNIGYKITQRIGGATAIGPVLQGLAKPMNDLSRGCSAEDVIHMIAVTSAQISAG